MAFSWLEYQETNFRELASTVSVEAYHRGETFIKIIFSRLQ